MKGTTLTLACASSNLASPTKKNLYLTIINFYIKIKIGNGGTTNVVCQYFVKNTSYRQVTDVFLFVYLLKNTMYIIKANTIIVSTTKPNKSKYIISNKTASIIAPPPFSQLMLWIKSGKPHLLILIPYVYQYTTFLYKIQANIVKIYN